MDDPVHRPNGAASHGRVMLTSATRQVQPSVAGQRSAGRARSRLVHVGGGGAGVCELTDALVVSLKVALVATVIATVLGSMIAIALSRYNFKGRTSIDLIPILPLTAPEIVMGSSLSTLFYGRNVTFGFWAVVIAHVMFQVSFVALTVRARIRGFDWTLEQAAQDLGASPMRTFWKITFPLILPGILAGALLAFALSIDDFIITFFNEGSLITFPIQIFGASRVKIPPQINVLASMILIVSICLLGIGALFGARRQRRYG